MVIPNKEGFSQTVKNAAKKRVFITYGLTKEVSLHF